MMRYDVIRQATDNECGAAVLASLARHYGRAVPLSWLRERMGVGTHGCDLATLQQAATDLGFEAHACEATWDILAVAPRPAVLHVTDRRQADPS
jgi:ATP-binding cassette subfamily C protein